jgi:uncharacterized protein YcgL (UPF0745 family)
MKRTKRSPGRDPTFEDFLQICREADNLLAQIKNPKAQGKKPINLKAALIHYLAEKKGINITLNHLYQIFGKPNYVITENKKIIKQILEEEHFQR